VGDASRHLCYFFNPVFLINIAMYCFLPDFPYKLSDYVHSTLFYLIERQISTCLNSKNCESTGGKKAFNPGL
jgi:hypothetical protein